MEPRQPTSPLLRHGVMNQTSPALAIRNLTKRFERVAVDALDLDIRAGEFYALLGPNGAGKTTTVETIIGLNHM